MAAFAPAQPTRLPDPGAPAPDTPLLPPAPRPAVPGDNSVDLFTNDLGLVVVMNEATGELEGFNLVAGGGMGERRGCWGAGTRRGPGRV